jgi:uncharacterized protein
VQHALRAFTPKDQKAVKIAAQTFRPNALFSTESVITELGIGEALVSVLDDKGSPTPVERVLIVPPASKIGPIDAAERAAVMARSPYKALYEKIIDRESAYEILTARVSERAQLETQAQQQQSQQKIQDELSKEQERQFKLQQKERERLQKEQARVESRSTSRREGAIEAMAKSAARAIGSNLGRQIVRGILGSLLGGRR